MKTKRKTTEEFIVEAKMVHGNKYDYSKVEYVNAHTKVCIICPKHGEFWQTPNSHLNGRGCSKCKGEAIAIRNSLTTEEFIKKAKEIHGDKYDYSKVEYIDSRTKICIICPIHGEFYMRPNDHLMGHGCQKCKGENSNLTTEEFIKKAKEIHGDKYDYSKIEYKGTRTKVCIICPIHGEFWQKPILHLNGHGCIRCNNGQKPKTTEEFIAEAKMVHGNKYDYSKVIYRGTDSKVCIICPKHGEFLQTPHSHLNGCGCPICSESKLEKEVAKFLEEKNIKYEREYAIKHFKTQFLDFFIPNKKIVIECQGRQHFEPIDFFDGKQGFHERIINDISKYQYCIDNGFKIIYYSSKIDLNDIVNNEYFGGIYNKNNIFFNLKEIYDQF